MPFFLSPDNQITMRQHTLQMRGDSIAFSKPAFAISMAAKRPQIGPVIDIESDLTTSVTGQLHRLETGGGNLFGAEMRTGDKHSPRRSDKPGINIIFANGHIGTVFTIKDQREGFGVANTEDNKRRQPCRIGDHVTVINTFAHHRFTDKPAHMFITDPGDERRSEPQPGTSDADIGRAAADIFRKTGHILKPPADLATIEINR